MNQCGKNWTWLSLNHRVVGNASGKPASPKPWSLHQRKAGLGSLSSVHTCLLTSPEDLASLLEDGIKGSAVGGVDF